MSKTAKHTRTPWAEPISGTWEHDRIKSHHIARGEWTSASASIHPVNNGNCWIAKAYSDSPENAKSAAAHIVKCVNERDELVADYQKFADEVLAFLRQYGIDDFPELRTAFDNACESLARVKS